MSREKTFSNQASLPRLPLPSLNNTCSKYLESVKPFLSEDEYFQTEFHVNLFKNGPGKDVQKKLEDYAKTTRNWLQDFWYDSYLDYRGPLPVISNIAGGVEPLHKCEKPIVGLQYQRASVWIYNFLKGYLKTIRQEVPTQKLNKCSAMDMSQFANWYCAGRIPGEKRDTIMHYVHLLPKDDGTMEVVASIRHIVVLMKGRIFKLRVFDAHDNLLTPQNLERQILKIKDICDRRGDGVSIGSLTAADRNTWYKAYKHMGMLDRQNKINVNIINEAILGFGFDDIETYGLQDSAEHSILGDCTNRWYDKSCSASASSTGLVVTCEDHIHLDGNVGITILQTAYDLMIKNEFQSREADIQQDMIDPVELQFTVDDFIKNTIKEAQTKHRQLCASFDIHDEPIDDYGKTYSKSIKIHPDTLVQLAVQLGYYALHKRVAATYESGTTRSFYHGRTETVRSCTLESKAFVESMFDAKCDISLRQKLFLKAAEKHMILMKEACSGQGIDRHLLILKKFVEKEGIPLPGMFKDKGWKMSGGDGNYVISTSLSGFVKLHGGLAPLTYDGYGAFYTIEPHRVNMCTTTWKGSEETKCSEFHRSIVTAFHMIHRILMHQANL